jgi:hypothetical protein
LFDHYSTVPPAANEVRHFSCILQHVVDDLLLSGNERAEMQQGSLKIGANLATS